MSEEPEEFLSISNEQKLYLRHDSKGVHPIGWYVVERLTKVMEEEMNFTDSRPQNLEPGTIKAYDWYAFLLRKAELYHERNKTKSKMWLTEELIGFEGQLVEVVDRDGKKSRFWVGISSGWAPCHLELKGKRSKSGPGVMGAPYKSVRKLQHKRAK